MSDEVCQWWLGVLGVRGLGLGLYRLLVICSVACGGSAVAVVLAPGHGCAFLWRGGCFGHPSIQIFADLPTQKLATPSGGRNSTHPPTHPPQLTNNGKIQKVCGVRKVLVCTDVNLEKGGAGIVVKGGVLARGASARHAPGIFFYPCPTADLLGGAPSAVRAQRNYLDV